MDREAWFAAVFVVTKSRTRLSNWTELKKVGWFISFLEVVHLTQVDEIYWHEIVYYVTFIIVKSSVMSCLCPWINSSLFFFILISLARGLSVSLTYLEKLFCLFFSGVCFFSHFIYSHVALYFFPSMALFWFNLLIFFLVS